MAPRKEPVPVELPPWYSDVLNQVKQEIKNSQGRAVRLLLAANAELVTLYWRVGAAIASRQEVQGRAGVIKQLAADLRVAYPELKGFSPRSLRYMTAFFRSWPNGIDELPISQLPWGHIMTLLDRAVDPVAANFYATRVLQEGWSRNFLLDRIIGQLYERCGQAPNTFTRTLPETDHDLVVDLARDPYMLDFLGLHTPVKEYEFHQALLANLTRFLQELGMGFAFVGSEYRIKVGNDEAILDLLFYHLRLRRYIIFELKTGKFEPEYAGKLNYYINVVDGEVRDPKLDGETIGILLVTDHDKVKVEYALHGITTPMAVSRYQTLPAEVRKVLPTEDQLVRTITETQLALEGAPEHQNPS